MSRFRNTVTEIVVSVADSMDERFNNAEWEPADKPAPKPVKKAAAKRTTTKS